MSDADRIVVAITALGTPVEAEAKALAGQLGTTPYEVRLKLTAGLPAIVLSTTEDEAAADLVAGLRERGHRAVVCHTSRVVAAGAMVGLRRFEFADDALVAGAERLPWDEITVLVRARHLHQHDATTTVKERKFDLGRVVATGGFVMSKVTKREVKTHTETSEQVLYVFRSDGGTPWLLREQATNYAALGAQLTPTANVNFGLAIAALRKRATQARFDDSLLKRPTIADVDLYAHLLAM